MTEEQEDAAIQELRGLLRSGASEDEVQARSIVLAQGYDGVARKAHGSCRECLASSRARSRVYHRHVEAWREYPAGGGPRPGAGGRGARGDPARSAGSTSAGTSPSTRCGWRTSAEWGLLILVARSRPGWRRPPAATPSATSAIRRSTSPCPRALKAGRPVFAMFDYCYPDSHSLVTEFLGRPARTPAGLLLLARRFGYTAHVVSAARGSPSSSTPSIPPLSRSRSARGGSTPPSRPRSSATRPAGSSGRSARSGGLPGRRLSGQPQRGDLDGEHTRGRGTDRSPDPAVDLASAISTAATATCPTAPSPGACPSTSLKRCAQRAASGLLGAQPVLLWHAGEPLTVPVSWYREASALLRASTSARIALHPACSRPTAC